MISDKVCIYDDLYISYQMSSMSVDHHQLVLSVIKECGASSTSVDWWFMIIDEDMSEHKSVKIWSKVQYLTLKIDFLPRMINVPLLIHNFHNFWPIDLYWISFLKQCLGKLADVVFSAIVVQMPSSILWTFQSWKWLYIHQCPFVCLSVCSFICPQNSLAAWNHHPSFHPSSFILHHLSFIIPRSSFIILHSSFLHFATFKLFS